MAIMRKKLAALTVVWLSVVVWVACGGSGDGSGFNDGENDEAGAGSNPSGSFSPIDDSGASSLRDGSLGSCETGCLEGAICKYNVCIPNLGACSSNDTCPGDSYCDIDKICVPYGVPPGKVNDPSCAKPFVPGNIEPTVQCEWDGPPDGGDGGDLSQNYRSIYTAPMVADLNLDLDPNKLQPSVVVTTWTDLGERIGMLRVFDGRTCTEQMRIGGPDDPDRESNRPGYGTQWAIGDLDNDVGTTNGHPEIVGMHRMPGNFGTNPPLALIAFKIEVLGGVPRLVRKWTGRICSTDGGEEPIVTFGNNENNYGPGIWDLDDDGRPEVVLDKNVFDANGCFLNPPAQFESYLSHGVLSTVADVDLDGKPDLVRADGVYDWNAASKQWQLKSYFKPNATAQKPGHIAVADLGRYSSLPNHPATDPLPEVIVVSSETTTFNAKQSGTVRVQTLKGDVVFGPVPLYKFAQEFGGHGGPPTASDFDGDGQIEFAAAANEFYTVYDPDCDGVGLDGGVNPVTAATRPGGKCSRPTYMNKYAGGVSVSGILWAQPSSDFSSSETGSSIFDFNGDGKSEAVYRDECYLRVYEGATGNVLFSAPAGSGTGQELPVIVDVDGDFATEIVVSRATNNPTCSQYDPIGPDAGTRAVPFVGNKGGFVILRDPLDRWASSRPIWNQHAYSITNVTDDGRIPKSSAWLRNWEQPGMNNFRQNTQGALGSLALADLTAQLDTTGLCSGQSGSLPLTTRVCNRGTNPVQDGAEIAFYSAPRGTTTFDAASASVICRASTPVLLTPGTCTTVTCTGTIAADVDVFVVTDPNKKIADCHPGNNNGASARVLCPGQVK